ncbi:uncharacterized protein LOC142357598 [Convolutriloba macropyga]|uniref:uncharacterized protein LOC142357598 n=1 Tax=Convolutriloba macropyga TaxID=536237 RepID=UPI003F51DA74
MAPLPKFRFPEHSKLYPFVNTGMDIFGPFHIEKSRTQTELNYVCMFTCLVTRAVHLEVCEDLSTDCLLMAIQRFVSRRGYPDVIVSDNGKNLVGANQAMKLNFQENYKPDNNYIRLQLAQQNIQWTVNPLLAPHFGGVWERLIQRTKWQQANAELKEDDVVWLYKDFTPRGNWLIGRIVKAHLSRDGVARSFDIKTSTGMVQRPAVRLGKVFETDNDSSSSLAAEGE